MILAVIDTKADRIDRYDDGVLTHVGFVTNWGHDAAVTVQDFKDNPPDDCIAAEFKRQIAEERKKQRRIADLVAELVELGIRSFGPKEEPVYCDGSVGMGPFPFEPEPPLLA